MLQFQNSRFQCTRWGKLLVQLRLQSSVTLAKARHSWTGRRAKATTFVWVALRSPFFNCTKTKHSASLTGILLPILYALDWGHTFASFLHCCGRLPNAGEPACPCDLHVLCLLVHLEKAGEPLYPTIVFAGGVCLARDYKDCALVSAGMRPNVGGEAPTSADPKASSTAESGRGRLGAGPRPVDSSPEK